MRHTEAHGGTRGHMGGTWGAHGGHMGGTWGHSGAGL